MTKKVIRNIGGWKCKNCSGKRSNGKNFP